MINKREVSEGERNDIVFTVYENRNSKYWFIIRNHLLDLLDAEDRYLDSFKYSGMNDMNSFEYNDTLKKIAFIKRMINVNEEIVNKHTTILEKIKSKVNFEKLYNKVSEVKGTFVGMFKDSNGNSK